MVDQDRCAHRGPANARAATTIMPFLALFPKGASRCKVTVTLDNYTIKETRSVHEDTNYITAALSVNGRPIGDPLTKFMGNQNNGTFPVGFSWPNVDVSDGESVTLFYQILNSGHKNHAELEQALTAIAQQQLPSTEPTNFDWRVELLKWAAQHTIKLVFANCDGPIAPPEGRRLVWHPFELKGLAPGTTSEESVNEHGNNSPTGCGKNSHYIVRFSITAASVRCS